MKNILISQNEPLDGEKSPYSVLAKKYGLNISYYKFFQIEAVSAKEFRATKLDILEHTAIIFTGKNTIDYFFSLCKELRVEIPDSMKYFCATEAVAMYLQKYVQYRKRKIFFAKNTINDIIDLLRKNQDEFFLFPCAEDSRQDLMPSLMDESGVKYSKMSIYRTVASDISHLNFMDYDLIGLFSPVGVETLLSQNPDFKHPNLMIAAHGKLTHQAFKDAGISVDMAVPTDKCHSIPQAIEEFVISEMKRKKKKVIK